MKSYLIVLVAIIMTALAAMTVLAGIGIYACLACDVLHFQESKIAALTPDVDTVVLGDSAIGYALDAETFSELSHKKTVKLALTGVNYGIGGAYVLLAEVLARDVRPKNVLIAVSAQTLMVAMWKIRWRPIRGFLQAARRHPRLLFGVNEEISWRVAKEIGVEMFDGQLLMDGIKYASGRRPVVDELFFRYDYYRPAIDVVELPQDSTYTLEGVPTSDYDVFFEKIAGLCKTQRINCIFMFGPLMQKVVEHSALTFRWETAQIERAGIKVVGQSPIKIPDEDLGNTINHIQPYVKQEYTRKIYDLVAASLR
jgi:hypothetical protein